MLVIGVLFLFISSSCISISGIDVEQSPTRIYDGKTLYVGGSGPENYTKIQDAIDNASDGDTVFVFNGTYVENFEVNKSINLIGENKNTTTIVGIEKSGEPYAILFKKPGKINISGFTIRSEDWNTRCITIYSHYNRVYNNILTCNYTCDVIKVDGNHNIIENNTILSVEGILVTSEYTLISGNTILANDVAITLLGITAKRNTVIGNFIKGASSLGIYTPHSDYNTISFNVISDCDGGILLWSAEHNTVAYNNLTSNKNSISLWNSKFNSIENNNFIDNVYGAGFTMCFLTRWDGNYWNKPRDQPYIIWGRIILFAPWINIDFRPAQEPYNIKV
jgi:parallel beta-helix repeat protein